jgi:hypothetical protein
MERLASWPVYFRYRIGPPPMVGLVTSVNGPLAAEAPDRTSTIRPPPGRSWGPSSGRYGARKCHLA